MEAITPNEIEGFVRCLRRISFGNVELQWRACTEIENRDPLPTGLIGIGSNPFVTSGQRAEDVIAIGVSSISPRKVTQWATAVKVFRIQVSRSFRSAPIALEQRSKYGLSSLQGDIRDRRIAGIHECTAGGSV